MIAEETPELYEVSECNRAALTWFLDVADLMVFNGSNYTGLDLPAIKSEADLAGREYAAEDFQRLRHLGRHAARELNKNFNKR